jgi:hypothetical protein
MSATPSSNTDKLSPILAFEEFDNESDCDSLMPRKLGQESCEFSVATTDMLSLCSGSTNTLDGDGDDSSVESVGGWNFSVRIDDPESILESDSVISEQIVDDDVSTTASVESVASQETIQRAPVTITTPSQEMLDAIRDTTIGKKAVRADDAEVPVTLWNMRVRGDQPETRRSQAFSGFRSFGRRLFQRAIYLDCMEQVVSQFGEDWYTRSTEELPRVSPDGKWTKLGWILNGIRNLLWYVDNTNFFEYTTGSKTYYFRFPIFYRTMVRDGVKVHFEKPGPVVPRHQLEGIQPTFPKPEVRAEMQKKVYKVKNRRYLVSTTIENIMSIIRYFAVPKGDDDVRIVYDATASNLNDCVWAPSFWLPTVDSLLRALDSDSWMADRDIGDMFLNFELHHSAWPFVGIDLQPVIDEADKDKLVRWYHWVRNLMGFRPSPYCSIKTALVAEEVVRGDRTDSRNPYQWDRVVLNLPGPGYDPTKAWVSKVRLDGSVASDLFTFVDDERITGATEELTWQAGHALAAKQAYLGIQDAARKVGACSQQPRAWAGAVVHVVPKLGVCVLTSEEKWRKLQHIIEKWLELVTDGVLVLDHKELLSDRGFLIYVTRSYPGMVPYLKGFHLTIEMWRGNRDEDGWKLSSKALSLQTDRDIHLGPIDDDEAELAYLMRRKVETTLRAPKDGKTPIAPRLLHDLRALKSLTSSPLPPLRIVRPAQVVQVLYGFGDASGKGFGSTVQGFPVHALSSPESTTSALRYRVGIWGRDEESESSNYRELANLVLTVEAEAANGSLDRAEFFLFTDNSTAESAFYKGSSSSRHLHELVLRLRRLELRHGLTLHVIHVSGKRMIAQGTDGCSRGVLLEGVMVGHDMLSFVDLAKTAVDRCPQLLDWIRGWSPDSAISPLTPEDWYVRGHGISGGAPDKRGVWIPTHEPAGRTHLWCPPPAAADAALEQLLQARHKRTDTTHIVMIPRLMAPRWRRLFHKAADCCFTVAPGPSYWPSDMFEPLWVGIVLPFYRHSPWQLGRAPLMVDMGRKLHRVCSDGEASGGHLLRKLCRLPRRLATVSPSVARAVLQMPRSRDVSDVGADG